MLYMVFLLHTVGLESNLIAKPLVLYFPPDTIPFELTAYNNIVLKAVLNQTDTVRLMLHTAASGVTLIKSGKDKLKSIQYNDRDTVKSWGGESDSQYSKGNHLQIGRQEWENVTIWENEHSGQTTDGKVGLHMFADKVIRLDFDSNRMIIYDQLPEPDDAYTAIDINIENGLPFIEASIMIDGKELNNRFLIHSGYSGAILLDDEFVAQNGLADQLEITDESILKDSYGNELKTLKAVLPAFQIGSITFEDIPVGFFSGAIGRQKMSVLGGDVLKRFDLIFDLKDSTLYLRPNALESTAYRK
jgi:hypothetical protein